MPAAMTVTLFLLLLGGIWTQGMAKESQPATTSLETSVLGKSSVSLVSNSSEAKDLNPGTSDPMRTRVPEEGNGTKPQVSPSSSDLRTANEGSFREASIAATSDPHDSKPMVFREVSSQESSNVGINANSNPAEPPRKSLALHVMTNETVATSSLGTFEVTSGPPVTMTTSSLETSEVASGPPVTMATSPLGTSEVASGPPVTMATASLETSDVDSGTPITMATASLETSDVDSGPPVTMATASLETSDVDSGTPVTMATASLETSDVDSGPPVNMATASLETSDVDSGTPVKMATASLETSDVDSGPPVTMATASLETSDVDSGPPVTMATGSPTIPKGTPGSPLSTVKTLAVITSASSKDPRSTQAQGTKVSQKGTLLVAALVALLVVLVLVALLLLWRQRQKRRTGVLTLSGGGKRNGVVDAWAGPARVPEEEALVPPTGGSGGEKGPGASAGEEKGPQPTLTTFFDKRKSQQCSLELGELQAGSAPAPLLKAEEEEHLVGSKDEEASEGPEMREVEGPQCL